MSRLLLISELPGELRAAQWEDDRLTHLLIERDDKPGLAGRILPGRITRVDKALGAAFVALRGADLEGFLPLDKAPQGLGVGDKGRFRIAKPAAPGKDPGKGPGLALAAEEDEETAVEDWLRALPAPDALACRTPAWRRLFPGAAQADWAAAERYLLEALDSLTARRVALTGGGALTIEPVATLTAIDVDSSRDSRPAFEINLEAAAAAARQIALRALSGLIVIDFLPLEPRAERRALAEALCERLEDEGARLEVEPPGPSGVTILHRQRLRPALHEIVEGAPLWPVSPIATAFSLLRQAAVAPAAPVLTARASPAVIEALQSGPAAAARDLIEDQRGHNLALEPDPLRDDSSFEIS